MMFKHANPNPQGSHVGDCVVRALSIALHTSWELTYLELCIQGLLMGDMPSSNAVWGAYLRSKGFKREAVSDICSDCYDVRDFVKEHTTGTFVLATGDHVITAIDGDYYDDWDSGDEVPVYFWRR